MTDHGDESNRMMMDHEKLDIAVARYEKVEARVGELKGAMNRIVKSWEVLPEGYYGPNVLEDWLMQDMTPSINNARQVLDRLLEAGMAEYCLKCGEPLKDGKCLYCPKTFNDGLEAAAKWHDEEEARYRNFQSAHGDSLAFLEKAHAVSIRSLKEQPDATIEKGKEK